MDSSQGAPGQSPPQSEGPGLPPQSVPSKSPSPSASILRPASDFLVPTAQGLRQHPSQAGQPGRPRVPSSVWGTNRLNKKGIEAAKKEVEDAKNDPQRQAVAKKELEDLYKRYDKMTNRRRLYSLKKIEPKHIAAAQAEVESTRENAEANKEARALLEYCLKRQTKEQEQSHLQKIRNDIEDAKKEVEANSDDQKRREAQSKLDELEKEYAALQPQKGNYQQIEEIECARAQLEQRLAAQDRRLEAQEQELREQQQQVAALEQEIQRLQAAEGGTGAGAETATGTATGAEGRLCSMIARHPCNGPHPRMPVTPATAPSKNARHPCNGPIQECPSPPATAPPKNARHPCNGPTQECPSPL
eukprot:jgi/Botrbrau1/4510/Bobra.60_2s0001.1